MSRRSRSVASPLALALAICLALAFVLPSSFASTGSSCEQLRGWAEAYAGTQPTIDQIARLDAPHRNALLGAVTPAMRAALWREHFARFAARPDLSPAQRMLVHEAITLATPALYAGAPFAMATAQQLSERATPAFAGSPYQRAWADPSLFGQSATRSAGVGTAAGLAPFCECSSAQPISTCPVDMACLRRNCNVRACGFMGMLVCDGLCFAA